MSKQPYQKEISSKDVKQIILQVYNITIPL